MKEKKLIIYLTMGVVITAIWARLLPHWANFTPVGAAAILAGAYLPKSLVYLVPLVILALSDLIIGFYSPAIMFSVYASFLISVYLGSLVRKEKKFGRILLLTLSGSLIFFLITNGAVWLFSSLYPKTLAGLVASYIAGLPFWRNQILGDLFYSGVFFGVFSLVEGQIAKVRWRQSNI